MDLFEYSQKSQLNNNSYIIKFINYPDYHSIVDAFITNKIDIATVTLFEALYIQSIIKTNS